MEPGSPEILRPPTQYPSPSNSPPASPSTPPPPPPLHNSSSRSPSNQEDGRDEDEGLPVKEKLTEQAAEIKGLKAEVKKLKQCMNGVHVIGRYIVTMSHNMVISGSQFAPATGISILHVLPET